MDIIARIKESFSSLTKSQKIIAAMILEDPMTVAFLSIEQFSQRAHVSTATIVRFANFLGLNGFSELQEQLHRYCQLELNPVSRMERNHGTGRNRKESILDQIYEVQLNNLRLTYTPELEEKILATVEQLKKAPRIYATGSRGSAAITYYLGHHLDRVFHKVEMLEDDSRLVDRLMHVQPGDALIVCSMPRYNKRTFYAAKTAKIRGATVITITDSIASPCESVSDILLPASGRSGDFHNSLLSAMLIAEMLITLLMSDNATVTSAMLAEMEPYFEDMDTFL